MMTERMALLWSVNPRGIYPDKQHLVGSVLAHMAHIERYGAVYWRLATDANLDQFEDCYPMSGYLYCSDTGTVDYRVRIIDISSRPRNGNEIYVPTWRKPIGPKSNVFLLLDQIDKMFPSREFGDFIKITDDEPVQRQPIGSFTRVRDPLF